MRVLIACEFSGRIREAFQRKGHDAWSCDLLPTEVEGQHIQGDVLTILDKGWDLMIAHPPCPFLTVTANKWMKPEYRNRFPFRQLERENAVKFFMELVNAPIKRIAVENPIGIMSTRYRTPDQVIQPWMFGHGEVKATCLWLKNLPLLRPTRIVEGRMDRVYREAPSEERWKNRSRTFEGVSEAMASQWGNLRMERESGIQLELISEIR